MLAGLLFVHKQEPLLADLGATNGMKFHGCVVCDMLTSPTICAYPPRSVRIWQGICALCGAQILDTEKYKQSK